MSALDHPNICAIYDVDSAEEQLFIAMAYYPDDCHQKKHVVFVGGHFIVGQQRSQVVKTVLDWLDERLGPVNPTSQASR